MNVYIGGAKDYSAMRGPCPEGFHIPMKDEWVGVNGIMTTLGNTTVNSYISNLHLHLGRFIERQGTKYPDEPQIGYWSCTKYTINNYAYALFLYSYNGTEIVNPNQQFQKNRGFPIRPFKDTFVTPTASWTVIQGALGSAGIFWNTTDGIISITGDGITGYTIADKDLGATTVYNNGNTKTDANCGKCYQWGNNYGFVFSSGLTTSSTQVNASNYGPGNYYSSSTFVTTDPRDSSNNANLWGGETGIVSIAELKQAYIGEYKLPVEYSYDFRNKNWSTLQSDGWTLGSGTGTIGYSSNGIYNTTYATSLQLKNLSNISFSDASKIYLEITAASNMLYSGCALGIGTPAYNGVSNLYTSIAQEQNYLRSSYDMIYKHSVSSSPETTIKVTLNIDNATYSFNDGVGGQSNGDIASGYITRIKNSSGIWVGISINSSGTYSTTYIKNIKIIKEY